MAWHHPKQVSKNRVMAAALIATASLVLAILLNWLWLLVGLVVAFTLLDPDRGGGG